MTLFIKHGRNYAKLVVTKKINWRETYKELEKVSELLADFARVST